MTLGKIAPALAIALVAMALYPSEGQAQQRDRCHDYANEMSSIDQRAQHLQCRPWTKKRVAYDVNYNWCQRVSPSTVQDSINRWQSEFQRCQFQASGSPAAQPPRPAAGPTLRSGVYTMNSSNHVATVTLNVQGAAFSGQSSWQCCPSSRIDPIMGGRIANGRISFVRDCRGQGYPGQCRQTYQGVISGNTVSGTWSGTGAPPGGQGNWSMRLR
jgi:hypothetical protein